MSEAIPAAAPRPARIESVDLLRGLVMVVMAIDHTRDFFHFSAIQGLDPLDLGHTTPAIFLTRIATHYCAPIFSFLAGAGVYLSVMRGKSKGDLSHFLVTRGLWLIFLEMTVLMWFGWEFKVDVAHYHFATLWALGWSMIVLAGLIHLPFLFILTFSLTLILGHNALDSIAPASWGRWGWLWQTLHAGGSFETASGIHFHCFYPLIPWPGIMAAGYCFGALYRLGAQARKRLMLWIGFGLIAGFVLLRASNAYGNLTPWAIQPRPGFTLLSFINVTKYPPSLCYVLMTLGPGVLLLALLERGTPRWARPILIYGSVPFFYYILHIVLLHCAAYCVNTIRVGRADFSPVAGIPPPGAGVGLAWVYVVWATVVISLYPACRWFSDLKRRRRDLAWLSYF
jgi:uncharacterized membrane protein